MPRNNLPPGVRKIETEKGETRYEVRIETTGAGGRRQQTRRRFAKLADALEFYSGTGSDRARGVHVAPNRLTVRMAADNWLAGKRVRPKTRAAYITALRPLVDALGDVPVQQVTKADIEKVVTSLVDGTSAMGTWNGPKVLKGKQVREPWKATSINPMLARARNIWDDLMKQGAVIRNVPALVDALATEKVEYTTLAGDQVERIITSTAGERYGIAWHLAVLGLRRGEIAALRWDDVDFTAGALHIRLNRTAVAGGSRLGEPKTETSKRSLPIPKDLAAAFRRTRKRQLEDKLRAADRYTDSGFVVVDEHGRAPHPDTIGDEWTTMLKRLKLPRVRLHDARHSCATLMHARGVPIADIAAWLGHQDASFTQKTYAHSTAAGLRTAAATIGSITAGKQPGKRSS